MLPCAGVWLNASKPEPNLEVVPLGLCARSPVSQVLPVKGLRLRLTSRHSPWRAPWAAEEAPPPGARQSSQPEFTRDSTGSIRVRMHRRAYTFEVACSTEMLSLMAWCYGELKVKLWVRE